MNRDENAGGTAAADLVDRRLLDDAAVEADASKAWAIGLLRGAEPYRTPPGRKQRVQLRLGHTVRRRAPLILRLAAMAVVLFGGAAVVSAGFARWPGWMARAYDRVAGVRSTPPVRTRTATRTESIARPTVVAAADAPAPVVGADASVRSLPLVTTPRSRQAAGGAVTGPKVASGASEDTSAVSAAMRALRVDRDPARARRLLAKYLAQHPNGSLAEEALAMTIEAAIAERDPGVARVAARYLELYPRGAFEGMARQALATQPARSAIPPSP
jgi:hypothetical protein